MKKYVSIGIKLKEFETIFISEYLLFIFKQDITIVHLQIWILPWPKAHSQTQVIT